MSEPEPWLRGAPRGELQGELLDVPAHVMPVLFSFQQVREDLAKFTANIAPEQVWLEMAGRHSLGYHLKHIAGSVDRLTSYLVGDELSADQLAFLCAEHTADQSLTDLLALVQDRLEHAGNKIRRVSVETLFEPRFVGRQKLPTSVMGLLVHVCEHTQRHLGQAILLAKLLKQE